MKNRFLTTFLLVSATLFVVLLFASFTSSDNEKTGDQRANTAGVVTFTATTSPAGGNYAPKHVLAIWVEKNGVFVKTRKAMANARHQTTMLLMQSPGLHSTLIKPILLAGIVPI